MSVAGSSKASLMSVAVGRPLVASVNSVTSVSVVAADGAAARGCCCIEAGKGVMLPAGTVGGAVALSRRERVDGDCPNDDPRIVASSARRLGSSRLKQLRTSERRVSSTPKAIESLLLLDWTERFGGLRDEDRRCSPRDEDRRWWPPPGLNMGE